MKPKVNIIIRTHNEENWIKHCLKHILGQNYDNFFITIVDSGSTDATLQIVQDHISAYPEIILLESVAVFKPGNAINIGARAVSSDYFICISAHCIPENGSWISDYVDFMEHNNKVVGAFGRQIPLSCTQADDARDLMITFGSEQRIFEKDYFFHNANSIIRTEFWKAYPFDDEIPHVEDRIWAKKSIELGYKTAYLPQATVYHYHGLHQHGTTKSFRAVNVLNVMHSLEDRNGPQKVSSLLGQNIEVPIVIIVPSTHEGSDFIDEKLNKLLSVYYGNNDVFLVSGSSIHNDKKYIRIDRSEVDSEAGISLRDLMRNILLNIENKLSRVVDGLIFYDMEYKYIDPELGQKCCEIMFDQWISAVLPAWKDYGNYWIQRDNGLENIHSSYSLREDKPALYRSVLGQGGAIRASLLRSDINDIPIGEVIWTEDTSLLIRETNNA